MSIAIEPKIGDTISARELGKAGWTRYIRVKCSRCKNERWIRLDNSFKTKICGICQGKRAHRASYLSRVFGKPCPKCGRRGFMTIDEDGFPHCFCGKVIYA